MQIELPPEKLSELKLVQCNVTGSDYIKVTYLLMLHKGFIPKDISESLGIDISTLYRYAKQYNTEGISKYWGYNYKGY
jgi:hypothetical protein